MKFKTAHAKVLSLLLTLVMVLSTAAVFAEGGENAAASEPTVTTQEDQSVEPVDENNGTVPSEEAEDADQVEEPVMNVADAAQITVTPTSATVKIGTTTNLAAKNAEGVDITTEASWTSSDDNVATVAVSDGKAVVTANATGAATITASINDGADTATCEITVPEKLEAPTGVDSSIRHGKGDNGVTVKWTPNGADKYILMRGTSESNMKDFMYWRNQEILTLFIVENMRNIRENIMIKKVK